MGSADAPPVTETPPAEAKPEDTHKKEIEAMNKGDYRSKKFAASRKINSPDPFTNTPVYHRTNTSRSVAEFRNLQDRTKRDVDTARSFAISRFASDLVESVDNLDRALGTVPTEKLTSAENKELVNLYEGLKMTETILMQTLKKHGLERFDPSEKGEKFDPNLHEATFQTKVEGKDDGDVFMTQQKGFSLNGRVVRAAKVGVVKNS